MRILNLADSTKGDILYSVSSFSDTQKLINLEGPYAKGVKHVEKSVTVISRMTWDDVQLIILAKEALKEAGFKEIHLYVPYFLGARSDRKFKDGSVNYLKHVICPIINSLNFESVTVMDPHSRCLEMGLNNFKSISNAELLISTFSTFPKERLNKLIWLIPDKGASDKALAVAKEIGFDGTMIECIKHRDKDGNIIATVIPSEILFQEDECVIVDDICDGGGTFIELAKVAKKRGAGKLHLVVTHGIFSKGLQELAVWFETITYTNSIKNASHGNWLKQINVI